MQANSTAPAAPKTNLLPYAGNPWADLRAVVGEEALVALALEAVQSLEVETWPANPAWPNPRMMLTLLAYGYASGILGAAELEQASRENVTLRYICAREAVQAHQVKRFRRNYRPWIERALALVIARSLVHDSPALETGVAESNVAGGVLLTQALRLARDRLKLAMLLDTADGD